MVTAVTATEAALSPWLHGATLQRSTLDTQWNLQQSEQTGRE